MEVSERGFMVLRDDRNSLGMSLNVLQETSEHCDIDIVVGDEKIKAHTNLVSARSSVYKATICGSFKQSDQKEIKLKLPFHTCVKQVTISSYESLVGLFAGTEGTCSKEVS